MAANQQSSSPRRLLLVEDDGLTAATISELLTSHGFLVETVPGAAEAQRTAKDFDPDVALIDVSLGPGPTGADLALALSRSAPHEISAHVSIQAQVVEKSFLHHSSSAPIGYAPGFLRPRPSVHFDPGLAGKLL